MQVPIPKSPYKDETLWDFLSDIQKAKRKMMQTMGINFKEKWVSPGTFTMGCSVFDSDCEDNEVPRSEVTLERGFYMMETEVAEHLYNSLIRPSGKKTKRSNYPVRNVSWREVILFSNKLSEMMGMEPCYEVKSNSVVWEQTDCGWRLPTEAEWEYAARGPKSNGQERYAGSKKADDVAVYKKIGTTRSTLQLPCTKKRNGFELCDMSGNVAEWTWDIYGQYLEGPKTDPLGATKGKERTYRGGSFGQRSKYIRVSHRNKKGAGERHESLGFRLVRNK